MANADAFMGGFSAGSGKDKDKKKDDDKTDFAHPKQYKKGGMVKKTGMALVHKGELVLTAAKAKHMKKGTRKRAATKR